MYRRALLVTDVQNDFLPGGALPVPHGEEIIPVVNQLMLEFELVLATQDWHPPEHVSFAASHPGKRVGDIIEVDGIRQRLWPVHCVENSAGADFSPRLERETIRKIFLKGTQPNVDSYSSFTDNRRIRSTGLEEYLREQGVKELYLCGLATDYCIRYTAMDARRLGFDTYVILDACRGINVREGDIDAALKEMAEAGVHLISSSDIFARYGRQYKDAG